jgi:hypothetical protein
MGPLRTALALVLPVSGLVCADIAAQGVTTAAIYGVVAGADSAGIADATITVTNTSDGERWQTVTHARGRYSFEYLSIGGPYTVEAKAIGFEPARSADILLSLGERRRIDFSLAPAVVQLPEVVVNARTDPRLNAGRTGPAQTITGALATRLPIPHQDFSRLILLSPQAVLTQDSGVSIAGQSDQLNGLQIDGATNSDLGGISGLSGFGTPGSASGVRTLSVEAIRELQIAIAPFDVRYGGFAGGLVNAVTRSCGPSVIVVRTATVPGQVQRAPDARKQRPRVLLGPQQRVRVPNPALLARDGHPLGRDHRGRRIGPVPALERRRQQGQGAGTLHPSRHQLAPELS